MSENVDLSDFDAAEDVALRSASGVDPSADKILRKPVIKRIPALVLRCAGNDGGSAEPLLEGEISFLRRVYKDDIIVEFRDERDFGIVGDAVRIVRAMILGANGKAADLIRRCGGNLGRLVLRRVKEIGSYPITN